MTPIPLRAEFLFRIEMNVEGPQKLGSTPLGERRIGLITGGHFSGPAGRGEVLPGGADWMLVGADDATRLDVRAVLRSEEGQLIGITYQGVRHAEQEVLARLNAGEVVDPSLYYMRTVMRFETAPGPLDWLNRVVAVAIGQRPPQGPIYDVYRVL